MKENKYDDEIFFKKYSEMNRSANGLSGAGEWSELQKLLPDFKGKRVLDLGCGYGWHCLYAAQNGAASVLGVDILMILSSVHWLFIISKTLNIWYIRFPHGHPPVGVSSSLWNILYLPPMDHRTGITMLLGISFIFP